MILSELKAELAAILAEEESSGVDWEGVEALCEQTYVRLTEPGIPQNFPQENVIGYLAGYNRRRTDQAFGERQRHWLREFLRAE